MDGDRRHLQYGPLAGTAVPGPIPVTTTGSYLVIDVTGLVKYWIDNPGQSRIPVGVQRRNSSSNISLDSKENATTSHPAELDITLEEPAGPQDPREHKECPAHKVPQAAQGPAGPAGPVGPQGAQEHRVPRALTAPLARKDPPARKDSLARKARKAPRDPPAHKAPKALKVRRSCRTARSGREAPWARSLSPT